MTRLTKGVLCIVLPFVAFSIVLLMYGSIRYFDISMELVGGGKTAGIHLINFVINFFGVIGVLGIFLGIPIGVYLLITSDEKKS